MIARPRGRRRAVSIVIGLLVVLGLVAVVTYAFAKGTKRDVDPDAQQPVERGPVPHSTADDPLPGSGPDRRAHGKP
jgi:hypothetical protein